jgi:hypothetical protein
MQHQSNEHRRHEHSRSHTFLRNSGEDRLFTKIPEDDVTGPFHVVLPERATGSMGQRRHIQYDIALHPLELQCEDQLSPFPRITLGGILSTCRRQIPTTSAPQTDTGTRYGSYKLDDYYPVAL